MVIVNSQIYLGFNKLCHLYLIMILKLYFRHYSIPYHLAKRGRLRKKGTRLHIYLDHVFVARWIRGYGDFSTAVTNYNLYIYIICQTYNASNYMNLAFSEEHLVRSAYQQYLYGLENKVMFVETVH